MLSNLPTAELFQDYDLWKTSSEWAWYLFLALPVAAFGAFWWQRRRTGTLVFGNTLTLRQLPRDWISHWGWAAPGVLRLGVLALLVFAISRPQEPRQHVVTTRGVDVIIALDMSASMNAVDKSIREIDRVQRLEGRNPKNRFDVARDLIIDFIAKRAENGDRVGLVLFGYGAYVKFPLTTDYARAAAAVEELILDDGRRSRPNDHEGCMNECTIAGAETHLGDALRRSFLRVRDAGATDRSIILITDGDDNGSKYGPEWVAEYISEWGQEIDKKTKKKRRKIPVYTFLIGGGEYTAKPRVSRATGALVRSRRGLFEYEDAQGRYKVKPDLLASISKLTGGESFHGYDEETFRESFKELMTTRYKRTITDFPEERFMHWAWLAFLVLGLEVVLRLAMRKFP